MAFIIWAIAFTVVGLLMGGTWMKAYSNCKQDKKWILMTPLWIFFADIYEEDGASIRNSALVYSVLVIIMMGIFISGAVASS
ncbi:MAG TPA: hypothetical protein VIQ03_01515 [Gammaproteobacteria bacterium]